MTSPLQYVTDRITKVQHPFKLNFITLTLSDKQQHTDQYIQKHMLQPFLKWVIRQGAKGYVWKAEKQGNGNLHYHITTNCYIEWQRIRAKWNDIQFSNHYLDNYFLNHQHYDPNSTDVRAVKDNKKALKYMAKYITKKEADKESVKGHLFGYSKNLTNLKITLDESNQEFREVCDYLESIKCDERTYEFNRSIFYFLLELPNLPTSLSEKINMLAAR